MKTTRLLACDYPQSVLRAGHLSIAYSAYGYRHPSLPPGLPGFNGELPDALTGYYLLGNGYRAYNPVLRRFNSPDSWSPFRQGGLNAYAYCLGDPVNRQDPTGHYSLGGVLQFLGRSANTLAFGAARSVASGARTLGERIASGLRQGWQVLRPSRLAGEAHQVGSGRHPSLTLQHLPDLPMREITSRLSGDDLLSLSRTSRGMKDRVHNNVRTALPEVTSAHDVETLRAITLGTLKGYLPSRVTTDAQMRSATLRVVEWNDASFARARAFIRDAKAHDLKLQRMDSALWNLWWRPYYRLTQAWNRGAS